MDTARAASDGEMHPRWREALPVGRPVRVAGCRARLVCLIAAATALAPWRSSPAQAPESRAEVYSPPARELEPDRALGDEGAERAEKLALFYHASRLQTQGDWDAAIEAFRKLVADDPGNIAVASHAARLLAHRGQFDEALAMLEKTLVENPDSPDAYLEFSIFCSTFHQGNEAIQERAIAVAQDAVERFPRQPSLYDHLVDLLLAAGRRDEASAVFELALAQESTDPEYWIALGRIAPKVWPLRTADDDVGSPANLERINAVYRKALAACLEGSAQWLETAVQVADFFRNSGQSGEAVPLYRTISGERPDDLSVRMSLAQALRLSGQHAEALAEYERLTEINPYDANLRTILAEYYENMGDEMSRGRGSRQRPTSQAREAYAKAAEHFDQAIRLGQNSANDYIKAMILHSEAGSVDGLLTVLNRATLTFPQDPRFPYQHGKILIAQETYGEAVEQFRKAEELAENLPSRKSIDAFLDNDFYFEFGAAAERSGDLELAAELFRKSIDRVPEDTPAEAAQAYNYLGYMWVEKGINLDEAGELIRMANELKPDNAAYVDSLGWFHFMKGNHEEALRELLRSEALTIEEYEAAFEEAVAEGLIEPTNLDLSKAVDAVILDHIAQAYFALGKVKEAVSYLERAVEQPDVTDAIRQRLEEYRAALGSDGDGSEPDTPEAGGGDAAAPASE